MSAFTAAWVNGAQPVSKPRTYAQNAHGFTALHTALATTAVAPADTLIVMEAAGSYWIALTVTLHAAGYLVSVINPLQAHHFAKPQLRRAKPMPWTHKTSPASPLPCVPRSGRRLLPYTMRCANACSCATAW